MICWFSLKNANLLYEKAKSRNFDTAQTTMFFMNQWEKWSLTKRLRRLHSF